MCFIVHILYFCTCTLSSGKWTAFIEHILSVLPFLVLFKGYQFEDENPYLSHPDPLSEGVKRMEAGDIPGAVRFFESAVQKEPENQLVRIWKSAHLYAFFSVLKGNSGIFKSVFFHLLGCELISVKCLALN